MTQQRYLSLMREVDNLVGFQLQALSQHAALNATQARDCRERFERIMDLQEEVARLRKERIIGSIKRRSVG